MGESGRSSVLLEAHRRAGARLVDFAGWDMPLQFTGIVAEHNAVRTDVGVFDVSHLGKLRVRGSGAPDALQCAVTADVGALEVGRATYALVLADDGGCIDDVFVYRLDADEYLIVPNAANVGAVAQAISECGATPEDEWERWAILALQGPRSFEVFEAAWPGSGATELALHSWCGIDVFGAGGMVARTGYTGERGFELYAPAAVAERAWDRMLELGATPTGLGARDTLRLEMGYALYGHELTREINPLEANLGWILAWETPFRGREALTRIKEAGVRRKLFGIKCTDRGVPRQGYTVLHDGVAVGTLTSGNFSPTLRTGIGLALGPADTRPAEGVAAQVDARGRLIQGDIVRPPFVKRG
jgi:aminomethyltransferase